MLSIVWRELTKPFTLHLDWLVTWTAMQLVFMLPVTIQYWVDSLHVVMASIVTSWLLAFVAGLPRERIAKILGRIITTVFVIMYIAEYVAFGLFGIPLGPDVALIVLGTNAREASEFIDVFITFGAVCKLLVYLGAIVIIYFLCRWAGRRLWAQKHNKWVRAYLVVAFLFLVTISVQSIRKPIAMHYQTYPGRIVAMLSIPKAPDTASFLHRPKLQAVNPDLRPQKFVLIIGESHCKNHSSIYGYEKLTNPLLGKMIADSSLYAFDNVESADLTTIQAFTRFMSTYRGDDEEYWKYPTIPEVASIMGYSTMWLSTQDKAGYLAVPINSYAELCDTAEFIHVYNPLTRSSATIGHDSDILPVLDRHRTNNRSFYFVHLMGSHHKFNLRYPAYFAHFKPEDYPGRTKFEQEQTSYYDNSLLYNDFVLNSIINRFANDDAIIVYMPDHGLDMFVSSPERCCHGIPSDPISEHAGHQIPFFVYLSPSYAARQPQAAALVKATSQRSFSTKDKWDTTNLIYTILGLCGYRLPSDQETTPPPTLFHPQPQPTQLVE